MNIILPSVVNSVVRSQKSSVQLKEYRLLHIRN